VGLRQPCPKTRQQPQVAGTRAEVAAGQTAIHAPPHDSSPAPQVQVPAWQNPPVSVHGAPSAFTLHFPSLQLRFPLRFLRHLPSLQN
jgi:hypothetical protein